MSLIIQLLYFLFILAAVVLIVVILLQEGKGGGFGQALGTSGQETFGAGARGINTFTAVVVGVFLASAMLIHVMNRLHGQAGVGDRLGGSVLEQLPGLDPAAAGAGSVPIGDAPAGGSGGTTPPSDGK